MIFLSFYRNKCHCSGFYFFWLKAGFIAYPAFFRFRENKLFDMDRYKKQTQSYGKTSILLHGHPG